MTIGNTHTSPAGRNEEEIRGRRSPETRSTPGEVPRVSSGRSPADDGWSTGRRCCPPNPSRSRLTRASKLLHFNGKMNTHKFTYLNL